VDVKAAFSSMKGEGAVLRLQGQAFRQSIGHDHHMRSYLVTHGAAIYDWFHAELKAKGKKMEDLMFVTGHVKTSAWATWTTREVSGSHSFSLTGVAPCFGAGLEHSHSHMTSTSAAHACGPNSSTTILRPRPSSRMAQSSPMSTLIRATFLGGQAAPRDISEPQTPIRSLESAAVLRGNTSLAELRRSLHASHRVPENEASIEPNQCLLLEGFRMQRKSIFSPLRQRKALEVPADASGALDTRGSDPTQSGSSASAASSSPTNQATETTYGGPPSNSRSHVNNVATDKASDSDIEVITIGDAEHAAVCITFSSRVVHLVN
jgi:hypothetical protein